MEYMGTFEIVPIVKCYVLLEYVLAHDLHQNQNKTEQPEDPRARSGM